MCLTSVDVFEFETSFLKLQATLTMKKCSLGHIRTSMLRHCSIDSHRPKHAAVAELIVEAEPSIAMSSTPPKRGRYTPRRVSGIQVEVLQLYRNLLKEAQKLDDSESRNCLRNHVVKQFRANKEIPRKMVSKIEWHMHYAKNKLEELKCMKKNSKFRIV